MTKDRLSALLSLIAEIVIVGATFFQWWDILMDGGMRPRWWVRPLLVLVLLILGAAIVLLLLADSG
jgi:hypothetical protein